jgi:AraC family transcriptional regulator
MEAIRMNGSIAGRLEEPQIVEGKPLLIAGLSRSYTHETSAGIPAQWQEFVPHIGHIPGQAGGCTYGVLCNGDDEGNYDYLCGVEVTDFSRVPKELTRLRIPEQRYAVFAHRGHVSEIRATCSAIWSEWLPASSHRMADGPMFELYRETFDPDAGIGGIEVWVPLE